MDDKNVLTIRETSKSFGFPEFAIRKLVKNGQLPIIQVGNRAYIVRTVFEEYLENGGSKYESAQGMVMSI